MPKKKKNYCAPELTLKKTALTGQLLQSDTEVDLGALEDF